MRAYSNIKGWQYWIDQHKKRFKEMKKAGLDLFEIWPQEMINGDFRNTKRLISYLNLKWEEEKVLDFITPALWSSGVLKKE